MKNFIKNLPEDIKQAAYSLLVSVGLISGSLLILGSYLGTFESDDIEVMAPAGETDETDQSMSE